MGKMVQVNGKLYEAVSPYDEWPSKVAKWKSSTHPREVIYSMDASGADLVVAFSVIRNGDVISVVVNLDDNTLFSGYYELDPENMETVSRFVIGVLSLVQKETKVIIKDLEEFRYLSIGDILDSLLTSESYVMEDLEKMRDVLDGEISGLADDLYK